MKFEEIKWNFNDQIQDNQGKWWAFLAYTTDKNHYLVFEDIVEDGLFLSWYFTNEGRSVGTESNLHLLPETYQPAKELK